MVRYGLAICVLLYGCSNPLDTALPPADQLASIQPQFDKLSREDQQIFCRYLARQLNKGITSFAPHLTVRQVLSEQWSYEQTLHEERTQLSEILQLDYKLQDVLFERGRFRAPLFDRSIRDGLAYTYKERAGLISRLEAFTKSDSGDTQRAIEFLKLQNTWADTMFQASTASSQGYAVGGSGFRQENGFDALSYQLLRSAASLHPQLAMYDVYFRDYGWPRTYANEQEEMALQKELSRSLKARNHVKCPLVMH